MEIVPSWNTPILTSAEVTKLNRLYVERVLEKKLLPDFEHKEKTSGCECFIAQIKTHRDKI